MANLVNKQTIVKQWLNQHGVLDLSSVFYQWHSFVYLYIPNNWLRHHGYPMHKRKKNVSRNRAI